MRGIDRRISSTSSAISDITTIRIGNGNGNSSCVTGRRLIRSL
jgi:hypothetical protein